MFDSGRGWICTPACGLSRICRRVKTPFSNVDLVVVRENTEGLYAGMEHVVVPGVVESLRIITKEASERIVRYAFDYARHEGPTQGDDLS